MRDSSSEPARRGDVFATLPACVRLIDGISGLPALAVDAPKSSGIIQLHGAQVTSFCPNDGGELLWLSPLAEAREGKAIRGGVPVCFPWFGPGASGDVKPAHGLARLVAWDVVSVLHEAEAVTVTLELRRDAVAHLDGSQNWPEGLHVKLEAEFGNALNLSLTAHNGSGFDVSFEEALHTYLATPDASATSISGVEGAKRLDQLTDSVDTFTVPLTFPGEVDVVATTPAPLTLHRPGASDVTVTRKNSSNAVLWNPAAEKTRRLGDVPNDGWREFFCIEAANVTDHAITLTPGGSHTLTATYAP